MSMSPGAAATTESPFDGDSDSVYGSKDTVLDSMDESDHAESFSESSDPTHPPPSKMASEEGFALREWRRLNAVRLAEKEREEKVILQEIIQAADEFKREFYSERQTVIENRKASNREKEKQYLANQERFHAEAHKSYWKAIAELIPHEVATIEKKGKKDKDRQPTVSVIMGPKPGKPTDMSRMRRVLVKLKHNTPPHMNHKPSPMEADKDAKKEPAPVIMNASGKGGGTGTAASASPKVAVRKGSPSNPP